jgi:hypothetical protein
MTGLKQTNLPTPLKAQLAAGALAGQGYYGVITDLAEQFGVSRPTVYSAGETADVVLTRYFEETEKEERFVLVDERQLKRAIGALRIVSPNSIRAIETLLPTLYPGVQMSFGKIQSILVEMEQRAAEHNRQVDLSQITVGALDEMFSQGSPVLAGVDLESGFLFSLALCASRGKEEWAEVLQTAQKQGLELLKVVKDAAQGIASGVSEVFPDAEQRDDCFHALYKMGRIRVYLERRALGSISQLDEAKAKLSKVEQSGRGNLEKCKRTLETAQAYCTKMLGIHDAYEIATREAIEAMTFIKLDTGHILTAEEMEEGIEAAARKMLEIPHPHCVTVGKYLRNRAAGLALYMTELRENLKALAERHGDRAMRLACLIERVSHDLECHIRPWDSRRDKQYLLGLLAMLHDAAGKKTDVVLNDVNDVLQHRYRASSAIEGFNAALRPFLYVQKGVTSGFLELFQAHHNLKKRRWGRHKGTSAHEVLTGEKVNDWLSMLGYPPSTTIH